MDSAQSQLVEKLQSATNILVTVSRNPSVDQLSACVGLTLFLNKFGKHATAVFSGEVPSTIEFLEPETTLEKTTDSLRDFIIALDKSKADKLRYKVEDEMVRIFITPYRTSISQNDLVFSQGDFNVDVVVALGVARQEDLDEAITSHGRILHDAVVSSINTRSGESLGSINWTDTAASSLSELVYDLGSALNKDLLDGQIATALLTGIVAETARFSNEKTTPQTMSVSAALMAAGANQQLVSSKLEESAPAPVTTSPDSVVADAETETETAATDPPEAGMLEVKHAGEDAAESLADNPEEASPTAPAESVDQPDPSDELSSLIGEAQSTNPLTPPPSEDAPVVSKAPRFIVEPPTMGGVLTANSRPEYEMTESSLDPLSLPSVKSSPLLSRSDEPASDTAPLQPEAIVPAEPTQAPQPTQILTGFTPPPPAWVPPFDDALNNGSPVPPVVPVEPVHVVPDDDDTLAEIEEAVHSPHLDSGLNTARDEVMKALSSTEISPEPIEALNAQPLGDSLHEPFNLDELTPPSPAFTDALQRAIPIDPTALSNHDQPQTGFGDVNMPPAQTIQPGGSSVSDPTAPPPVPPPIPFNFGTPPTPPQ